MALRSLPIKRNQISYESIKLKKDTLALIKYGKSILFDKYVHEYCICKDQQTCVHSKFVSKYNYNLYIDGYTLGVQISDEQ